MLKSFSSSMEKRQALDGEWYTRHEFQDYYGDEGQRLWDSAGHAFEQNSVQCPVHEPKHSASTGQVRAGCEGGDVKPLAAKSLTTTACADAGHSVGALPGTCLNDPKHNSVTAHLADPQDHANSNLKTGACNEHVLAVAADIARSPLSSTAPGDDAAPLVAIAAHSGLVPNVLPKALPTTTPPPPLPLPPAGSLDQPSLAIVSPLIDAGRNVKTLAGSSGTEPTCSSSTWLPSPVHSSVAPPAVALPTHVDARARTGDATGSQMMAVFTLAQLNQTPQIPGFGGKEANRKQRSLREQLLPEGIYEHDLTQDAWNWRQILKALPPHVQDGVVGAGIVRFRFRLLQNEMDPNYRGKIDSGERHVFQVDRVDGSAVHLHFHKNGRMDPPKILNGPLDSGAIPPAASSVSENFKKEHFLPPDAGTTPIGRNEAQIAFLNLLGDSTMVRALDVTNEVGFAWTRFLQNQFQKKEIIGPGISKALVVRFDCDSDPSLVLCRSDDHYVVITPGARSRSLCIHDAWSAHPLLTSATAATTPWMQISK